MDTSLGPPRRRLLVGVVAFAIATAGIGLAVASFLGPGGAPGGAEDEAQIVLAAPAATSDAQLVATSEIIQARLNAADISSSVSVQDGTIVVSLPNESIQGESRGDTLQLVSAAGLFEFREVLTVHSPGSAEYDSIQLTCAPGDATCEDDAVQAGPAVFMDDQGNKYELGPTRLSNGDIERVEAVPNSQTPVASGEWSVEIGLTPAGADKLANLTSELVGKQLAIVLDQQVLSAPTVQSPIDNGSVQVAGQFTEGQAKTLAEILSAPPLPVDLMIIDIVQPSPTVVEPSPTASGPISTSYTDQTFGWTLSYPASMHVAHFGGIRSSSMGVTVSNVPIDLGSSLEALRSFPPNGAVLRIWHNEDGLTGPIHENDTALPLLPSDFQEIDPYIGGSEPRPSFLGFNEDGVSYVAAVWFGPQASSEDRAAIAGMIASLRFPATHPGTTVNERLIVLGAADNYDVGSVTRFDRSELPIDTGFLAQYRGDFSFYLVHGTGGFYAVATDFLGNSSRCDLGVELDPIRFTCVSTGAIWDRFGHVLTPPTSPPADGQTDLLILPTPISWDGNIMLDPFGNWPQAAVQAWP
jgi:preprotein translocase subunit SecD